MAATVVLEQKKLTHVSSPSTCAATDSCSLKEFSVIVEKKKTTTSAGDVSYTTDARLIYRTDNVARIQDYAIVQYIRGCQYSSTSVQGVVHRQLDVSRHYMTGMVTFQHRDWSIDSDNPDPVYTAWNGNRFGLLRWNRQASSYNPETATFMAKATPPHPVVFATDMPGSFSTTKNWQGRLQAKNSSLEFLTCLFKTRDLPATSDAGGKGIDRNKALACHTWDSKFVYDFQTHRFKMDGPIEPFCLAELAQ